MHFCVLLRGHGGFRRGQVCEDSTFAGFQTHRHHVWPGKCLSVADCCRGISVGALGHILLFAGVAWDVLGMSLPFLNDLQLLQPVQSSPHNPLALK